MVSIGDEAFLGCSRLKKVINNSGLEFKKGSAEHGHVAYYAKKVINTKQEK